MKIKLTILLLFLFVLNSQGQHFEQVKDINPNGNSKPEATTSHSGKLFFRADDGTNGNELWISDGSETGTRILKDINTFGSSYPDEFTEYGGKLYFSANDEIHGREVWLTDGTAAGTKILKDINPAGSSDPKQFMIYDNRLYFTANDGINGTELWSTNGTTEGTLLLKVLNSSQPPSHFIVFQERLFFSADDKMYTTDGSAIGTKLVKNLSFSSPAIYNSTLIFQGKGPSGGYELWKSDGSPEGTVLLKDINPNGSSIPSKFVPFNNLLIFQADDGTTGTELWATDGSEEGTKLIKDINPTGDGAPVGIIEFKGVLYFLVTSPYQEGKKETRAIWTTDGTPNGTHHYYEESETSFAGGENAFTKYNGRMFCIARGNNLSGQGKYQIFEISGNALYRFNEIKPETTDGEALASTIALTEYNSSLYFRAEFNSTGSELWKYTAEVASIANPLHQIDFTIYPNPVRHTLKIEIQDEIESIQIKSIDGRLVKKSTAYSSNIFTGDLTPGVYTVHVSTNKGVGTKTFLKH